MARSYTPQPPNRDHMVMMPIPKKLMSLAADLAHLARTVADERPSDQDAQRRAHAATTFVQEKCGLSVDTRNEKSTHSQTRYSSGSRSLHLPVEICRSIVGYVAEFDYKSKQKTLVALSRTCRLFTGLAEEHLYSDPRDLDNIRRQWLFLYSLTVEPTRAARVKSLRFLWLSDGANGQLLVDIVTSCCNARDLLIQRGNDVDEPSPISNDDMVNLGSMLCACPLLNSFHYSTLDAWDEDRYTDTAAVTDNGIVNLLSENTSLRQAMEHLSSLTLSGHPDWVLWGLFSHLSSSLTSLSLSMDSWEQGVDNPFMTLSQQCPFLERLVVENTLASTDDFERACKAWGRTLKTLDISSIEEATPWVARVMPSMIALEDLSLGRGCMVFPEDIEAIACSKSPLKVIATGDMEMTGNDVVSHELNEALVRMIEAHSSTLEILVVNETIVVDISVMRACRKANNLKTLALDLPRPPDPSDVDALLDACTNLSNVPKWFRKRTLREDEWRARRRAREIMEEEGRRAGPDDGLETLP
ncbi:hypothetical protein FHETE_5932 [Fusarium heterosporum]|uniref:F-box domain-containing protein n=1 Tax=Fusarium heterosporum TaxID=42747 RepID=A0A8H5TDQ9_FUSHE|nr:hypothetical protein FHETE_5932 [Fusarium heterosporum]